MDRLKIAAAIIEIFQHLPQGNMFLDDLIAIGM